jgi:hypothetical protein
MFGAKIDKLSQSRVLLQVLKKKAPIFQHQNTITP